EAAQTLYRDIPAGSGASRFRAVPGVRFGGGAGQRMNRAAQWPLACLRISLSRDDIRVTARLRILRRRHLLSPYEIKDDQRGLGSTHGALNTAGGISREYAGCVVNRHQVQAGSPGRGPCTAAALIVTLAVRSWRMASMAATKSTACLRGSLS